MLKMKGTIFIAEFLLMGLKIYRQCYFWPLEEKSSLILDGARENYRRCAIVKMSMLYLNELMYSVGDLYLLDLIGEDF